jgi:hypothetical protein
MKTFDLVILLTKVWAPNRRDAHTHTNAAGVAALIQLLWRLERAATCSVPLLSNAFD